MSAGGFIGVVDLTVKLSSMNPLGHIDVREANGEFERLVIQACHHAYEASDDKELILRRGIVKEGPAAKFFHFAAFPDLIRFATRLRSMLMERRLPFKLCLRSGTLGSEGLRERWGPVLTAARDPASTDDARRAAQDALLRKFETDDAEHVETLFSLYLAPGFHDDAVTLAMDLETFKGFGIFIDGAAVDAAFPVANLFRNHFPVRGQSGRIGAREYIDCRFERSERDVVTRFIGLSRGLPAAGLEEDEEEAGSAVPDQPVEDAPATGSTVMIDAVMDLLRRSFGASEDSAVFYVSTLTTIVRSSHFGSMRHLPRPKPAGGGPKRLASGWQEYPPIFGTLTNPRNRTMLKRMAGVELVLGAVLDELYAALAACDSSAALAAEARTPRLDSRGVAAHETFAKAIGSLRPAFGDAALRKVLSLPRSVIADDRKRAVLAVISRQ